MTLFEHLRSRLLARAGLGAPSEAPLHTTSYAALQAQECGDGFTEMMDARLVMGRMRYGPMRREQDLFYDVLKAKARLDAYLKTGNTELLVDAANYCRLEFRWGRHPRKHFHAVDRQE